MYIHDIISSNYSYKDKCLRQRKSKHKFHC